jgi:hypothetical protein
LQFKVRRRNYEAYYLFKLRFTGTEIYKQNIGLKVIVFLIIKFVLALQIVLQMSSHHFVKEGQEPALLIADAISITPVEPVLEWAPLVIVLSRNIDLVLSWGIKIDVIIAQTDAITLLTDRLEGHMPVKILSHLPSENPVHNALSFLISCEQYAVNILVDTPEHYFKIVENFTDRLEIILFDDQIKWSAIQSCIFKKWLSVNTRITFYPKRAEITIDGAVEHNADYCIAKNDGFITVKANTMFWVGEYY